MPRCSSMYASMQLADAYRRVHMESTFDAHSIPKLAKANWMRIMRLFDF